jgi:hypothetical protein
LIASRREKVPSVLREKKNPEKKKRKWSKLLQSLIRQDLMYAEEKILFMIWLKLASNFNFCDG